ncbi:hypothetical protein [Megamonas sp.]|uniref:hypothetical protein n=1 Tax=Megamonas sp. TaxID=2049033 RepID=UPI00258A883C|nr:hypothetical protein [Megamonas sp.]
MENIENKKVDELIEKAAEDQLEDATTKTYAENDEVVEATADNIPDPEEKSEGVAVPETENKESWQEDKKENAEELSKDSDEQEGNGAFATSRSQWANGTGWGM